MGHMFVVARTQECVVDVEEYQINEGDDDLRVVAKEIAEDMNMWTTVHTEVMEGS